jgi:pilus assembly protein CpaD
MPLKPAILLLKAREYRSLWLAGAAAIALAGCATDYGSTETVLSQDYHAVHPIVLAQAPTTLDVFPVGQGGLDANSAANVRAFAARYNSKGATRLTILAPSGSRYAAHATVDEIRRVLTASGVRGYVAVGSYPVDNAALAAPIRLSFLGLKALVPSRCGQWPSDLASGSSIETWKNQPYWNYGCATQSVLAAQVDDPRDFAVGEALDPADEQIQLRAIGDVRQGKDPGTEWRIKSSVIGAVAGSN